MIRFLCSVLVVVAVLVAGTACGIGEESEPTVLPGGVVNPVLAAPNGEGATEASPGLQQSKATIYLVRADLLATVMRKGTPSDLVAAITLLLRGPTPDEFAAGLRSAISPHTTLHSARIDGDTAVIDLSAALVEVGGQEQILAIAQLVLTATAVPGATQVRFLLDGEPVEVPRADGTLTSEALRAVDYQQLLSQSP